MSVFSSIKNWFKKTFSGGGGGSSSRSSSSSRSRSSSTERASRVSNYGGGGSRSYRENYSTGSSRYQSREDEERRRRQEQTEKRQATTNALASISKRTDALASGKSSSPASSATSVGNGTTRVLAKIGEKSKATPPDPKEQARQRVQKDATKKLKQISDDRKEMNEATGNKYNVEQKDKKKASEARRRIRSGEMISDPTVARVGFEQHPIANLAGRKIAQGASFGLADLAENKLAGDKFKESRRLYKKAEKEHPWIAAGAELAGGMVGFGMTGGATDALGARAVSKLAPNAVDDLARSRLGQRLAKSAVDKAVKKGIVSESTEELVKQVGKDRARKIVNALGNEAVQNLTTGAVYDIANASNEHELFSDDWWKELGKSAAFNSIATTGVAGIAGLGGGRNLVRGARNYLEADSAARDIIRGSGAKEAASALSPIKLTSKESLREQLGNTVRREGAPIASAGRGEVSPLSAPRIGESIDETIARRGRQTAERNAMEARPSVSAQMRQDFIRNADNADAALNRGFTLPENRIDAGSGRLPANQVDVGSLDNAVPRMADNSAVRARADEANARYRREFLDRAMQRGNASASDGRMRLEDITNIPDIAVARIDDELEALNREILQKRNTASDEELMALTDRFDRLMANRKALLNPETREEEQLANALRKNAVAGRQARRGPEALSEAESARMRNAFTNNAEEAERNLDRGFVLLDDARTAPTDSGATNINIRRLADERQAARDANRRNTLEGLFANARANEVPREPRQLSDLVNIRTADDAANQARLREINEELDQVQREILLRRNTASPEELDALNNRFSELLDERRAIETPPSLEQRRTALQEERDNLFAEYQTVSADDSVSPLELQGMLDDMQELDLELRDLDAQIARESSRAEAPRAEAPAPQAVEQPKQTAKAQKAKAPKAKAKTKAEATTVEPKAELPKAKGVSEQTPIIKEENAPKVEAKAAAPEPKAASKVEPKVEPPKAEAKAEAPKAKAEPKTEAKTEAKAAAPKEQRTVYNVEDIVNKKRQRTSGREKIEEAYHATKRKVVNSMASFEDANLKNVKSNPEKWSANNAAVDKTRRHGAIAGRSIKEGQLQVNGKRFSGTVERVGADGKTYKIENGKSLMRIYDGMDEKTESAFDAYLLLKHAPDRIREGTPIFDNIKLASGESLNDVNVVNREADRLLKEHPEFAERAEEIYQLTQNELENRVKAGLLSQETAEKWMKDHPFYVPTGRDGYFNAVHGGHKGVIGADPIKAAKGSDLDIRSVKEQLAEAINRNWRDITTNNLLEKYFGDAVKADSPVDDGLELLNNTIGLSKSADGRRFYAKIFRDGEMHRVEIDKRYYDDLDDLYKNGSIGPISDTIASASSKFSGLFKKLVTSWNPFFMPKNFSRDIQDAIINTRQTKEFFESLGPAAKELSNDGEFLRAFRDSGVSQANLVNLDESLTNGKGGVFGKALDKFATLNEAVETWPRLAEFMATIKKAGYTKLDDIPPEKYTDLIDTAAANAADVTVNFARSGSVGKNLNKGLVPFFNPSVQGWSKFVRNFREQRGLKQMLGTIAKASTLGAGTVWINNTWLEDNPNYQRISARDKATNYIIPWVWGNDRTADNTDTFVKIPRGRFAAVYGLATVNAKNENEMGWAEMVKVGKDQIAPVDPLESSVYAPFLLAKKNETWYGSPIVPESIKNDTHPSEEYDQNTSYLGRALGKATENLPKELQISPKKADYIIDAESGVIGDFLLPALTPSRQGGGKGVIGKAGPAVLNVAKRQFTIDSTTQNDLSSRFYDKMQTAEDNKKSSKATDKDSAEYKRMNAYQKEVSTLTTAIRDHQAGDRATKQEDIRGLQEVRNKMMQDALDGKKPPSSAKAMDAVQKYVGTSYAIDKFGSSADKEAMKVYGASVYGNISEKEMQKKIDADKDFYKGVRAVGKMEDQLAKATGSKATSNLSKAVALASVGASDELFGAYEGTKKSRTETAIKMDRARNYISDGGSTKEFVKLEKARKTLGKLSDYDKEAELDNALAELKSGKINEAEYYQKQGEIKYNANISYVGLATSLAESNAPSRGYVLYDIKAKNVQKGINLAAMGFTARDYREMAKAVDADGNGYPKKQEIIDYVNSRDDIEDKATLYDALYYYKSSYNPFGTPTNYSREQAAENGKARGVEQISNEKGALKLKDDEESGKSGYRRYGRRGWRRWRRWGRGGHSSKAKVPAPKTIKASSFVKGEALVSKRKSSRNTTNVNPKLERVKAKIDLPTPKR